MEILMNHDSICALNFSTRTHNALINHNITVVGDLINLSEHNLSTIKNMGAKSIEEVKNKLDNIKVIDSFGRELGAQTDDLKTFIGDDGTVYIDICVEQLQLSNRSRNHLLKNKIEYFSQLLAMNEEELFEIPNLGVKSVLEIIHKKKEMSSRLIMVQTQKKDNTDVICEDLAKRISEKLYIDKAQLYALIMEFVSNLPDDVLKNEDDAILRFDSELRSAFSSFLYEKPLILESLRYFVMSRLEISMDKHSPLNGYSQEVLFEQLPDFLRDKSLFEDLLIQMLQEECILMNEEGNFEKVYPSVRDYILRFVPFSCSIVSFMAGGCW